MSLGIAMTIACRTQIVSSVTVGAAIIVLVFLSHHITIQHTTVNLRILTNTLMNVYVHSSKDESLQVKYKQMYCKCNTVCENMINDMDRADTGITTFLLTVHSHS